jgi:hypothetical protein
MSLAHKRLPMTQEEAGLFVWAPNAETARFPAFRRPSGPNARPIDEIAMAELTALAREMRAKGMSDDAAVMAMAREAGSQRIRAVSRERLEQALKLAITDGES